MHSSLLLKFCNAIDMYTDGYTKPIKTTKALVKIAESVNLRYGHEYHSFRELYDITEYSINHSLLNTHVSENHLYDYLLQLENILPTETERTKEQVLLQQFNTPLSLAYVMCLAANIRSTDTILEPSAGVGSIATVASQFNPLSISLNELSSWRCKLLKHAKLPVTQEDAKYLCHLASYHNFNYNIVLMNPPFARAGHRLKTKRSPTEAADHIFSALKLLHNNGRLVAIVGKGMSMEAPTFRSFWTTVTTNYSLQANILLNKEIFRKMGTAFQTRMLVIDNINAPSITKGKSIQCLDELIDVSKSIGSSRI